MTANAARGDVEVTLAGETLVLRPTFEALAAIEQRTGEGIPRLLARFPSNSYRATDVMAILDEGIKAAEGQARPKTALARTIRDAGLLEAAVAAARLLGAAITGPDGAEAVAEPRPTTSP